MNLVNKNTKYEKLANGLSVILVENHDNPLVAFQLWVNTGSADETEQQAGLAHVCEHLLFKGKINNKNYDFAYNIEKYGGEVNAWTSHDETVYHFMIPSDYFNEGLLNISKLLQIDSWDKDDVKKELDVILEEVKRGEDEPGHYLNELTFSTAYKKHPYLKPIIGYEKTVSNFTIKDITNFYNQWYCPKNITLIIVGDINREKAFPQVKRIFEKFKNKKNTTAKKSRQIEPAQNKLRITGKNFVANEIYIEFSFHGPEFKNQDTPFIDIAMFVFGEGLSSRLNQKLRREKNLVTSIYASNYAPYDPGLISINAIIPVSKFIEAVKEIFSEIFTFTFNPMKNNELKKAKETFKAVKIYQKESYSGLARKIGYDLHLSGDINFDDSYSEAIESATNNEIKEKIQKYITPNNLTITYLMPHNLRNDDIKHIPVTEKKDRTEADINEINKTITKCCTEQWDKIKKSGSSIITRDKNGIIFHRSSSGTRMILKQQNSLPMLTFKVACLAGLRAEEEKYNGVSNLTARLYNKGTKSFSQQDISYKLDELGSILTGISGKNILGITGKVITSRFDELYNILREMILEPSFEQKELEVEKCLINEELMANQTRGSFIAWKSFFKNLYLNHPYGMLISGTQESIAKIEQKHLIDFHKSIMQPQNMVISVAGKFDEIDIIDKFEKLMSEIQKHKTIKINPLEVKPIKEKTIIKEQLDKKQAYIIYGYLGTTFTNKDKYSLQILAEYLGNQSGTLFKEIREKHGLAYAVGASTNEGIESGYFGIYAAVSPQNIDKTIEIMGKEVEKLASNTIPEKKVNEIKNYLIGINKIDLQRISEHSANLLYGELYNTGYDEYLCFDQKIKSINAKHLKEIANKYFINQKPVIVIVTP